MHTLLKKSIEALYTAFLPKGTHPFVYLSLTVKSENVDVNVHPTKQQVHFLYEDFIVEKISDDFSACLAKNNSSRTFLTQVTSTRVISVSSSSVNDYTSQI